MCIQLRFKSVCTFAQSESCFKAWRNLEPLTTHSVPINDPDQTVPMSRLIRGFRGDQFQLIYTFCWTAVNYKSMYQWLELEYRRLGQIKKSKLNLDFFVQVFWKKYKCLSNCIKLYFYKKKYFYRKNNFYWFFFFTQTCYPKHLIFIWP